MEAAWISSLRMATEGLFWISVTDARVEFVSFAESGPINAGRLLAILGRPAGTPVGVSGLDEFFQVRTQYAKDQDKDQRAAVPRWQRLVRVLRENLADPQVFEVGERGDYQDVYILGRAADGTWAGLKTVALW